MNHDHYDCVFLFQSFRTQSQNCMENHNWCLIQKQDGSLMVCVHTVHIQVHLQVVVQWRFSKKLKYPMLLNGWGGGRLGRCPLPDIALESQDCTLKQTLSQRELHHERDPIGRMSLNKPCPISMHTTRSCSCPLKHATNKLLSACPHTHLIYWHRPNL